MQHIAGHDIRFDALDHRCQRPHRSAAPVHQRGVRDIGTHTRKDLVLAIERDVVVELRGQEVGQETGSGHGARDRAAWRRLLHDLFAAAAGFLYPGDLDDLQLRCDHIDQLAHVFAQHAQITAAIRPAITGIKFPAFARGIFRDTWAAARGFLFWGGFVWRGDIDLGIVIEPRRSIGLGHGDPQVFERQFQLFDLALDLFRAFAKGLFLQFGNPGAQGLNQQIMGAQCRRKLGILCLQRGDDHPQNGGIIGESCCLRTWA